MSDLSGFKWRHFQADVILCAMRRYLRYTLSTTHHENLFKLA
jgi:transposase-like protein